jgi:hypothetical protein
VKRRGRDEEEVVVVVVVGVDRIMLLINTEDGR